MPHETTETISRVDQIAGRVGNAAISFLAGIPQIDLDLQAAQTRLTEEQATAFERQGEAETQQQALSQQLQGFFNIMTSPDANAEQRKQAAIAAARIAPELVENVFSAIGVTEQREKERFAARAAEVDGQPTMELKRQVLQQQIVDGEAQGRDMSDSRRVQEMDDDQFNATLAIVQAAALTPQQRASALRGGDQFKLGPSVVVKDPDTDELSFITPVLGPDGQVIAQKTPFTGEIVSRTLGELPAEQQQRVIETAGGRTTAVEVSRRDQGFINDGQSQADATAIIRRGIQLLDVIGTGTFAQAALAARNLFSIAGANETELNANLGKAILTQIKTLFGGNPSVQEGERLQSIEANFSKSTAGNKRLLEQTLRSMERDARRGIAAARRNQDEFSALEIEEALKFTLDPAVTNVGEEVTAGEDDFDQTLLDEMSAEDRALFDQ